MSPLPLLVLLLLVEPLRAQLGYSVSPLQLRRGQRGLALSGSGRGQNNIDIPDTRSSRIPSGGSFSNGEGFNREADTIIINGIGHTISITPAVFGTSIDINFSTSEGVDLNTNSGTPAGLGSGTGSGAEFGPGSDFSTKDSFLTGSVGANPKSVPVFGTGSNLGTSLESNNIDRATTSFNRLDANQNRNTRLGAGFGVDSGPNSIANAGGRTFAGAGFYGFTTTASRPASTTRRPFSSRFGPNFGMLPGHVRRKTCTAVVNLTAEYDLRLIPYNIPVEGENYRRYDAWIPA